MLQYIRAVYWASQCRVCTITCGCCCGLQVSLQLVQLHNYIKAVVRKACEVAPVKEGFVPDPIEEEEEQGGSMVLHQ